MQGAKNVFFTTWARGAACSLILLVGLGFSSARADNATGVTGQSLPLNNRQPTLVMRYIIALQGIFPDNVDATPTQQTAPNRTDPYLGEIRAITFNFAPKGWAFCEGQLLPINQNQALFSLLQTTYGGNGQTTFALPDLRGRVPIGAGQGPGLPSYLLGQKVGNAAPTLTRANLPPHTHSLPAGGDTQVTGDAMPVDNRQAALGLDFLIAADGEIMIVPWPYNTTGWTRCDGRILSAATHNLLFQSIGTRYGGDATNFALPDLRGRVVLGDDNGSSWPLAFASGSNNVVLEVADIPAHTHTTSAGSTGMAGGIGNSASNYQPSVVLRWLIAVSGGFPSQTTGASSPLLGELRTIAGPSASGLASGSWHLLDGALIHISDNDALFNLIGTTYGGDGQNTFAIPDLRGKVDEHPATNVAIGTNLGSPTLAISLSQLAAHAHLIDLRITALKHLGDNSAQLTVNGMSGSSCEIDASNELVTWSNLGPLNFSTTTATATDPNAMHLPKRFYRALP